jgi:hypothetical protein
MSVRRQIWSSRVPVKVPVTSNSDDLTVLIVVKNVHVGHGDSSERHTAGKVLVIFFTVIRMHILLYME